MLDEVRLLTNRDIHTAEIFNTFLASVFDTDYGLWEPQGPVLKDCDWGDDNLPTDPEFVQDMLLQLGVHKSMGPDGIYPRVPKQLADVIAGPLSIVFQVTWESGEVPVDWKLANIIPISRRERRKTLIIAGLSVSIHSLPGKILEKVILGVVGKHLRNNTVIGHSQREFTPGNSCLTNLISFCDKVTPVINQGKSVYLGLLDFSKNFDTDSHNILLDIMLNTQLDKPIICQVKNLLMGLAQSYVRLHQAGDQSPVLLLRSQF